MNQLRLIADKLLPHSLIICLVMLTGCGKKDPPVVDADPPAAAPATTTNEPQSFETNADQLMSARLPPAAAADGWIRLFDGHTLFGWEITGKANWRVEQDTIVVDDGEKCFLCTSTTWQDYQLTLEFNADEATNSGIFLRTPLAPEDPAVDCYEVNIAPQDNPFPTGSIVKRQTADADVVPAQVAGQWRRMDIRVEGKSVQVSVDDKVVCEYTDTVELSPRRIALQHNSGRVAFRDIRLKPLGLDSLLDAELSLWTKYPDMPGEFTVTEDGALRVQGGKTQLESKQSFDDFVLLAEYKMDDAEMNSGIFFRCIPGDVMMGYECQISNERVDDNPLAPADYGTGGIFKRQEARIVAGEPGQWATVVLVARGRQLAAWVNGVQVSNVQDTREPDENPRKGSRLEAGTLMIQGHDEKTDALYRQLKIKPIAS
jgi:hypothetical protein